ncbi:MAG: DivIVA domain-containing protein [Ignavibacteria bacterium]|nr:DivIVA domain-containing protein [Ignavibacteria bacterium]
MNLTPKEIKKRDFKRSLRGYDIDEVDAFLDTVSTHYEKLLIDNKNLAEKIKSLIADIEVYKENEANLQQAIIKSQGIAEEVIQNAKKRAEIIIKEAELDARKVRQDIEDEILNKKQELEDIKLRNDKIIEDLKMYLTEKLTELEDFLKSRRIIKMELSTVEQHNEEEQEQMSFMQSKEEEQENIQQNEQGERKPVKKVYIDNPYDDSKKSFDDTFEIK